MLREEEAIKLDGLSVAEMKELRDKAEKFTFQAEVNRMMKLIINSLYRNKEVRNGNTCTVPLESHACTRVLINIWVLKVCLLMLLFPLEIMVCHHVYICY